ncbi:MAG TPA: thiamine pyrophosphate-dependent enzyme [Candidatus Thermoplasmatota archaeon]|nr:thiamine pyrophosphate-dependent enzyme [Candidatus Thermoplasmatota archaeon]
MPDTLSTQVENTWCPGCGNFGILNALKKAVVILEQHGIPRDHLIISSGIGCHGKIFDYINLSGLYSIHGRSMATVQGIKLANPSLKLIDFAGDGDAFGEGISHIIFAAKRNADITVITHDNGTYALTTGQFSPTSSKGFKGPSTPQGNVEEPLNPLTLLMEVGATFVARGYAGKIDHLTELIVKAVEHEGFSFIDVLQPSVVFNDTYKEYNERVQILEKQPASYEEAVQLAKLRDGKLPIGIFYQVTKPVFHRGLYGEQNPVKNRESRQGRLEKIRGFIEEEL